MSWRGIPESDDQPLELARIAVLKQLQLQGDILRTGVALRHSEQAQVRALTGPFGGMPCPVRGVEQVAELQDPLTARAPA
jgi:hypothetical protein